jgi:uncharacterized membrane protein
MMATEPTRYRGHSWAAFVYLAVAIVSLFVMVSSSMSEIHATGDFWQSPSVILTAIGTIVGVAGLIFTITRARRSNVNVRAANLAWAFGTVIFALALYGAARFDTAVETAPAAEGTKLTPGDYR